MESSLFSSLSSLRGEFKSEEYIQPHYKETYRIAIDHLVSSGRDSYQEFLKGERISSFLSEEELLFITTNAEQLQPQTHTEEINGPPDSQSSSGTYWPIHSDVDTPDLELGWPEIMHEKLQTNIDLLFHPPRQNNPTIKEVIRKHIQDARQVIKTISDSVLREKQKNSLLCSVQTNWFRHTVSLLCLIWELCSCRVCCKYLSPSRQFSIELSLFSGKECLLGLSRSKSGFATYHHGKKVWEPYTALGLELYTINVLIISQTVS